MIPSYPTESDANNAIQYVILIVKQLWQSSNNTVPFDDAYRTTFTLVINNYGDLLYKEVINASSQCLAHSISLQPIQHPHAILTHWTPFYSKTKVLCACLQHLDRFHTFRGAQDLLLKPSLKRVFLSEMLTPKIIQNMNSYIVSQIVQNREKSVDHTEIQAISLALVKIGGLTYYINNIGACIVKELKVLYTNDAVKCNKAPKELVTLYKSREETDCRFASLIMRGDMPSKINECLTECMLLPYGEEIISFQLEKINNEINSESFQTLYKIFSQTIESQVVMVKGLCAYFENAICKAAKCIETRDSIGYINSLAEVLDTEFKIRNLCNLSTEDALKIKSTIERAMVKYPTFKHLAKYCAINIRTNANPAFIAKIKCVFSFLQCKDLFEKHIVHHISKEALHHNLNVGSGEKQLAEFMRDECGNQFSNRLDTIIADIEQSAQCKIEDDRVHILIISQAWDIPKASILVGIPNEFKQITNKISASLDNKDKGKTINYLYWQGQCEMEFTNSVGKKCLITVSTIQAITLCYLCSRNYELDELRLMYRCELAVLKKCILPLIDCGIIILDGMLKLNHCYHSNSPIPASIKNTVKGKMVESENYHFEEQEKIVEALIVRTLKINKQISESALYQFLQLKGFTDKLIKERIKFLLELDYIGETYSNPKEYMYKY
jgi:hypothetical protein